MNTDRRRWNEGQQKLRRAVGLNHHREAIDLFLSQHAMVHASGMSKTAVWSFEDEVLSDMFELLEQTYDSWFAPDAAHAPQFP